MQFFFAVLAIEKFAVAEMTLTVTQLKFDKGFVANVLVSPIVK